MRSRGKADAEYIKRNLTTDETGRLVRAALGAADLCAMNIPKPRSLLGDGVLVQGGFALLYGKPGGGKTWLTLDAAMSLVRGVPWLGLTTPAGGVRVGLLQLELGAYSVQARLRALGVGAHPRDEGLRLVCRPMLKGSVDFCQPTHLAEARRWVEEDKLDVLMVDALSRAHTASENKAEELGEVLAFLDALRHDTRCAIWLDHHERKSNVNSRSDDDLDALRGHSRLQSDPTLLMRLKQRAGGERSLVFAKVSEGVTPQAVCFRLGEDGRPAVVQSLDGKQQANGDAVLLRALRDAGESATSGQLMKMVGVDRTTVWRHLQALEGAGAVTRSGTNKSTRWHLTTVARLQLLQPNGRNGGTQLNPNNMHDSAASTVADAPVVTEEHRCTVATVAPKGANGGATVATGNPPHGQVPAPDTELEQMTLLRRYGWEPVGGSDA